MKKSVRGLLCREKLEKGKNSHPREFLYPGYIGSPRKGRREKDYWRPCCAARLGRLEFFKCK